MKWKDERGFVLITVVILAIFLFGMVGSYFIMINTEKGAIIESTKTLRAEAIAEAGLEEALWEYNYGGADFAGWAATGTTRAKTTNFTNAFGTTIGSYTITITNYANVAPPFPVATVIATLNHVTGAKVVAYKAEFKPRPRFSGAVHTRREIVLSGNAFTDSYSSSLGPYGADLGGGVFNIGQDGDIRTNLVNTANAIDLSAALPVAVKGDAGTGFGSTIRDPQKITGIINYDAFGQLDDFVAPADLQALGSSGTLSSTPPGVPLAEGDYKFNAIDLTGGNEAVLGTGAGVIRIYITGDLKVKGTSQLKIANGTTAIIYLDGDVDGGGNGIANLSGTQFPYRLQIYGSSSTGSIAISGGPDFIGVLGATQADIQLTGNPGFYGAFIGRSFKASGGGGVHFDEYLKDNLLFDGVTLTWMRRSA